MHVLLEALCKGDKRSIGASNRVASIVLEKPKLIAVLFLGMEVENPLLRMRCADAIEKVTRKAPALLQPYKRKILGTLSKIEQKEVRWHVAPLLARLSLALNPRHPPLEQSSMASRFKR